MRKLKQKDLTFEAIHQPVYQTYEKPSIEIIELYLEEGILAGSGLSGWGDGGNAW